MHRLINVVGCPKLGIIFNDWKGTQTQKVKNGYSIILIHTYYYYSILI